MALAFFILFVLEVTSFEFLDDINFFDECFSSPLSRAKETAEIVLRESGNEIPVIIDDRIKEIFVGDWEGVSFRDPDHHAFIEDIKTYFLNPFELFIQIPVGDCHDQRLP